jgi:hypothetical protein
MHLTKEQSTLANWPDGTVRWYDEHNNCWNVVEPSDRLYSMGLMLADHVFRNGKWEQYAP